MNLFQTVKESVTTLQAAEQYGVPIGRNGLARCIFHADQTPSMKIDRRYYCFGCGATGDVIDFTAQLFGLRLKEAAEKLAADFGIQNDADSAPNRLRSTSSNGQFCKTSVSANIHDLCRTLASFRQNYAPTTPGETLHPLFAAALHYEEYGQYLKELLRQATLIQDTVLIQMIQKEVSTLAQKLQQDIARSAGECGGLGAACRERQRPGIQHDPELQAHLPERPAA